MNKEEFKKFMGFLLELNPLEVKLLYLIGKSGDKGLTEEEIEKAVLEF